MYELNYAKAKDIATQVSEVLTPSLGSVKADERSNNIIVTDTPRTLEKVKKIIQSFDGKHKEVLIQAKIIQVVLDDSNKMGIDWEAIVSQFHNLALTGDFDILGASDKRGKIAVGTLSNDDYTAMIEALKTVGKTKVLSSPRITAINNQEAKILVGSTKPYVTTTTTTPGSGPATTAETVNFIEVGVKLYVTPTIHNDGFITVKIKPEVSSATGAITTSTNNTIPVIDTSTAETTVMVKDGVTIILGGLIKEESIRTIKRVPVLGAIPFLGAIFRNESNSLQKTEITIFLKPTIISGDVNVANIE